MDEALLNPPPKASYIQPPPWAAIGMAERTLRSLGLVLIEASGEYSCEGHRGRRSRLWFQALPRNRRNTYRGDGLNLLLAEPKVLL